jgi:aryl-alcohol dehydrogenase-like predicted oxidoreductase
VLKPSNLAVSVRPRPLGKTGLVVSELALGTWGLSGDGYGPVEPGEAERTVLRALDIGFSLIDTADSYGGGAMEELLGRVLVGKENVVVATKVGTDRTTEPPRKRFEADYLRARVTASAKRLRRERIELVLLHNPSVETLTVGDAVGVLTDLKKEGLVGHWGAAVGDADVARAAIDRGAEVVELAYNLMHPIDLHRVAGDLMVSGVGVLSRSPLAYGLLAGLWAKDREFKQPDHRAERWTKLELERRVEQLDALRFLVKGDVQTMRAAAVRFVLSNHLVSTVVLGPRSVAQLEQLVRETGSGPCYLPDADLMALPRALARVGILT